MGGSGPPPRVASRAGPVRGMPPTPGPASPAPRTASPLPGGPGTPSPPIPTRPTSARAARRCFPIGIEFLGFRLIGELGRGGLRPGLSRSRGRPGVPPRGGEGRYGPLRRVADARPACSTQHRPHPLAPSRRSAPGRVHALFRRDHARDVYEDLETRGTLPVSGRGLLAALDCRRFGPEWPGALSPSVDEETVPSPARSGGAPGRRGRIPTRGPGTTLGYLEGLTYVQAVLWVAAALASGLAHAHDAGSAPRPEARQHPADRRRPADAPDFNLSVDGVSAPAAAIGGTSYYMAKHLEACRGGRRPVDAQATSTRSGSSSTSS